MIFQSRFWRRLFVHVDTWLSRYESRALFFMLYTLISALIFLNGLHAQLVGDTDRSAHIRWSRAIARGCGSVLNVVSCFLLLTTCRMLSTIFGNISGLSRANVPGALSILHVTLGHTILFAAIVHTATHLIWIVPLHPWDRGIWGISMTVGTGFIVLLLLIAMCISVVKSFRKANYQLCKTIHMASAVMYTLALLFHGMHNQRPETYKYIVPAFVFYGIDRIFCVFQTYNCQVSVEIMGRNILRLTTPKLFDYRAGQYVEVMIEDTKSEWHPFTIASAPFEEVMSLYVKRCGDWTEALYERVRSERIDGSETLLVMKIRGPFGAPTQIAERYKNLVMIAGGIGVTPFVSITKEICRRLTSTKRNNINQRKASQQYIKPPPAVYSPLSSKYRKPTFSDFEEEPKFSMEFARAPFQKIIVRTFLFATLLLKLFVIIVGMIFGVRYIHVPKTSTEWTTLQFGSWLPLSCFFLSLPGLTYFVNYLTRILSRSRRGLACSKSCFALLLTSISIITISAVLDCIRWSSKLHGGMFVALFQYFIAPLVSTGCILTLLYGPVRCSVRISCDRRDNNILSYYNARESNTSYEKLTHNNKSEFIWATPCAEDDVWIEKDLEAAIKSRAILMRRYVTREKPGKMKVGAIPMACKGRRKMEDFTEFGRPDWTKLLMDKAQKTENHQSIHIHFCGPPSMEKQIKKAARMVTICSQLRYAYLRSTDPAVLTLRHQLQSHNFSALLTHGSNIRFVIVQESFG